MSAAAPEVEASAPAPDEPAPPAPCCPDCGAPAPGRFCATCGQEQRDRVHTSVRELAREGVEELLSVDAKLATTLRTLLLRPGQLTVEYLAGRRTRYVRPLKLYLTMSVLYFLSLSLHGDGAVGLRLTNTTDGRTAAIGGATADSTPPDPADTAAVRERLEADSVRAEILARIRVLEDSGAALSRPGGILLRTLRAAARPEEQRNADVGRAVAEHTPKAFFALLPFFALLLHVAFRRPRRYYAEHLIAALHVHAFAFLVLALWSVLRALAGRSSTPALVAAVALGIALPAYVVVALRRIHGESWPRTTLKAAVVLPTYWLVVLLSIVAVALTAML